MTSSTISENKISDNERNQQDNKHNPVRCCTSVTEPDKEQKKKTETQHNTQNQRKTQLKWLVKEDNETYSIPMIINQQISREKIRRVANPRIGFQTVDKKQTVNVCS